MTEFIGIKSSIIKPATKYTSTDINQPVKLRIGDIGLSSEQPISIPNVFNDIVSKYSKYPAIVFMDENNLWHTITYQQYYDKVIHIAKAFIKLGLKPRDSVAVLSGNCPEWFYTEMATIISGAIITGIYVTNSSEGVYHVLSTSNSTFVIVDDMIQMEKIRSVKNRLPLLNTVIQINGPFDESYINTEIGYYKWSDIMEMDITNNLNSQLKQRIEEIAINECCCLIYTSGTVGMPKAVMLSHDTLILDAKECIRFWPDYKYGSETFVSYLPLNHVAAQVFEIFVPMIMGGCVYFADRDALKGSLLKTIIKARPSFIFGVPRVWEKIQEKIVLNDIKGYGISKILLDWAKYISVNYHKQVMEGNTTFFCFRYWLSKKILNKFKSMYGLDNSKYMLTGGAPTSVTTKKFFYELDINLAECYGLSETSGGCCYGDALIPSLTTSGRPAEGMEFKILEPNKEGCGEICIKGRTIFMGYFNEPKKTEECLNSDGWYHSGDQGYIDDRENLIITGRIKELVVTAGGENIAPTNIENIVKAELSCISNAFLVGDCRKYLTILLALKTKMCPDSGLPLNELHEDTLEWLRQLGLEYKMLSEILDAGPCPKVLEEIEKGIKLANTKAISRAQIVQKFKILPNDFSVPTGELGPTLKVCRNIINKKYSSLINELYK